MMKNWRWLCAAAVLGGLLLVSACSDDPEDQPPQAVIVYPEPAAHLTSAPDSVVVEASDDQGVRRVEIYLDGVLLSTRATRPYSTRLPLGVYADGRPYLLSATAYDTRNQTGAAPPVSISIDPSLQTVPQVTSLGPETAGSASLRLAWLPWPRQPVSFAWELARDDGFAALVAAGSAVSDTLILSEAGGAGLVYARVRATDDEGTSGWSRAARYQGLATWRRRCVLPGPQLGAKVMMLPGGDLRVLSHAVGSHAVARAPVALLELSAAGEFAGTVHELLPVGYLPTASLLDADDRLLLAGTRESGGAFVAAATLAGDLLWSGAADFMQTTALVSALDGTVFTVGADLRTDGPGGVFGEVAADGTITPGAVFPLAADRAVHLAWRRPAGGFVLAGPITGEAGAPAGGIWAMGLSAAHEVLWQVRLGSADRWLLRGGGADEANGEYVLAGIALRADPATRYGFLAGIDQDGRVRWQVTDRTWLQFCGVAADFGGRWVAVGATRREVGDRQWEYDFAMRGLSPYGAVRWDAAHRGGKDAQGWHLAPHPDGGWVAVGTRSDDRVQYDADVLRVDDRGELP
jgi:hypothetical protein